MASKKIDRFELTNSNDLIESLNDRVKHLSVLLTELTGSLKLHGLNMNDFNLKTKSNVFTKIHNVDQQSKIISHWINETKLGQKLKDVQK